LVLLAGGASRVERHDGRVAVEHPASAHRQRGDLIKLVPIIIGLVAGREAAERRTA
jgi:hypothetical protein